MSKYKQVVDGEWQEMPSYPIHKMACCDCGLVHLFEFRRKNNKLEFRAWRDERATGQRRRYSKST